MRYLLPWEKDHNPFAMILSYHRREFNTNKIFATIEYNLAAGKFTVINTAAGIINKISFSSFEEATAFADKYLMSEHPESIKSCNFYFIDKKDIKRFKEKLMVLL